MHYATRDAALFRPKYPPLSNFVTLRHTDVLHPFARRFRATPPNRCFRAFGFRNVHFCNFFKYRGRPLTMLRVTFEILTPPSPLHTNSTHFYTETLGEMLR